MTTYPLSFPAVGVRSSSFRLMRSVEAQASPFTGQEQVYKNQGEWWEGEVTLVPTSRVSARLVQAFLAELKGRYGTFLYGDPDALALGTMGAGGTITVNGASQTGTSLTVDGMTPSANNILKAGDYFQLGTGTDSRLYMVTTALNSNVSGEGTIEFQPALRSSPADNASVITSSPKGLFRLSENASQWDSDQSSVYSFTIAFREAL